jgi:hypothetical protein
MQKFTQLLQKTPQLPGAQLRHTGTGCGHAELMQQDLLAAALSRPCVSVPTASPTIIIKLHLASQVPCAKATIQPWYQNSTTRR